MSNIFQKLSLLLDKESIKLIKSFQQISILICLFSLFLLTIYRMNYISIILYQTAIILFKIGLTMAIFPTIFASIINKWKNDQNL